MMVCGVAVPVDSRTLGKGRVLRQPFLGECEVRRKLSSKALEGP